MKRREERNHLARSHVDVVELLVRIEHTVVCNRYTVGDRVGATLRARAFRPCEGFNPPEGVWLVGWVID